MKTLSEYKKEFLRDENNGVEPYETSNTIWWARRESNPH